MVNKSSKPKSLFLTGLAALLPTIITIFIVVLAVRFLYHNIVQPVGVALITLFGFITQIDVSKVISNGWIVGIVGFPIVIFIIFLTGYLAVSFLGQAILKRIEKLIIQRFPVIRSIYPYAKQFTELFLSSDRKVAFQKVVAVQYPRQGLYSVGFITSEGMKEIENCFGKKSVSVFIPSTPTPFTGFTIFVPQEDIVPLPISVDEGIRIVISAGVLIPPHQLTTLVKEK